MLNYPSYINNHNDIQNMKAFNSLSFRGKKWYGNMKWMVVKELNSRRPVNKSKTYGGIIIVKRDLEKNLYLLVQGRYTGKWSFPKGHSNENEEPLKCALREINEETGIDNLPEASDFLEIGYGNYYVFNLRDMLELSPKDTKEIMNIKWVSLDEMEHMALNADVSLYRKKMKGIL